MLYYEYDTVTGLVHLYHKVYAGQFYIGSIPAPAKYVAEYIHRFLRQEQSPRASWIATYWIRPRTGRYKRCMEPYDCIDDANNDPHAKSILLVLGDEQ